MSEAPIVLFVFNRLKHTQKTIDALRKNQLAKESQLFVFSDGPRNLEEQKEIVKIREHLRSVKGFKSLEIIERSDNWGLANSIIDGVTSVVNQYGKVIVIEDDLVTSPFFLEYMNKALTCYQKEEQVISIHGYNYPIPNLPETFFIKGADCWGWATWKRGWDLFEADGEKLLAEIQERKLGHQFDFLGAYPYLRMLKKQVEGKNNSWAIRWYASAFLADKLTLYPGKSLVKNIGCDDSGSHCGYTDVYNTDVSSLKVNVSPILCVEDSGALLKMSDWLRKSRSGWSARILRKIRRLVKQAK